MSIPGGYGSGCVSYSALGGRNYAKCPNTHQISDCTLRISDDYGTHMLAQFPPRRSLGSGPRLVGGNAGNAGNSDVSAGWDISGISGILAVGNKRGRTMHCEGGLTQPVTFPETIGHIPRCGDHLATAGRLVRCASPRRDAREYIRSCSRNRGFPPWLAAETNTRRLNGIEFRPIHFEPVLAEFMLVLSC